MFNKNIWNEQMNVWSTCLWERQKEKQENTINNWQHYWKGEIGKPDSEGSG